MVSYAPIAATRSTITSTHNTYILGTLFGSNKTWSRCYFAGAYCSVEPAQDAPTQPQYPRSSAWSRRAGISMKHMPKLISLNPLRSGGFSIEAVTSEEVEALEWFLDHEVHFILDRTTLQITTYKNPPTQHICQHDEYGQTRRVERLDVLMHKDPHSVDRDHAHSMIASIGWPIFGLKPALYNAVRGVCEVRQLRRDAVWIQRRHRLVKSRGSQRNH